MFTQPDRANDVAGESCRRNLDAFVLPLFASDAVILDISKRPTYFSYPERLNYFSHPCIKHREIYLTALKNMIYLAQMLNATANEPTVKSCT